MTQSPDTRRSPVQPILAVMGGVLLFVVLSEVLETTLVSAMADAPPTDVTAYFAVRNRPSMLAAKVVCSVLAAILAGYLTAKIAGKDELRYAGVAATVQTAALIWGFTAGEYASFTPAWARGALVLTTGPAMLLGALIRRKAGIAVVTEE